MEIITLEEEIRVGVAFDNRKVIPLWFRWKNRYYKVESVNFTWDSDQGTAKLRHYAVTTDGANTYELCFNAHTLEWTLNTISSE